MRKFLKIGAVVAAVGGVAVGGGAIGGALMKARELKKQQAAVLKQVEVKKKVSLKGTAEGVIAPSSSSTAEQVSTGGMFAGKNLIIILAIAAVAGYFLFMRHK